MNTSRPIPSSTPGIMIGRVNSSRFAPANGSPPRTSAKATIVPMIVAMMATTSATSIELSSAAWMAVSDEHRLVPVQGQAGDREARVLGRLEREQDEEGDRQVQERQGRADQQPEAAARLLGQRADRHRVEAAHPLSHG